MLPTDVACAPSTACYSWNFHEIIHLTGRELIGGVKQHF